MSCRSYDAGVHSEALRLATAVFIIAHDGGKNRCLLTHLSIKDQIPWQTSNLDITSLRAVMLRATPLVELDNTPDGPDFVPLCTYTKNHDAFQGFRRLSFKDWWIKDLIFIDGDRTLTRQHLVLALRNQDGGGHFDEELRNPNYVALKEEVLMFFPGKPAVSKFPAVGLRSMRNLALASMRQIAEEVRLSLGTYDAERTGAKNEDGILMVKI